MSVVESRLRLRQECLRGGRWWVASACTAPHGGARGGLAPTPGDRSFGGRVDHGSTGRVGGSVGHCALKSGGGRAKRRGAWVAAGGPVLSRDFKLFGWDPIDRVRSGAPWPEDAIPRPGGRNQVPFASPQEAASGGTIRLLSRSMFMRLQSGVGRSGSRFGDGADGSRRFSSGLGRQCAGRRRSLGGRTVPTRAGGYVRGGT